MWGSTASGEWLRAAGFGAAPQAWLELVLARIRAGPARLPWTAFGAVSLGGELVSLGGLGRGPAVSADAGRPAPAGNTPWSLPDG